jgi:hemoglobin
MADDDTPAARPMSDESPATEATLYEAAGGMPFFEALVDAFYEGVVTDAVLLPLYPLDDIDGARHRLTLFLAQYWGGPTTYMEERGHPKLRLRHMPFRVGPAERDHWLLHMAAAVERHTEPGRIRDQLMGYFVPAAEHLRNDTGLPISSASTR